MRTIGKVVVTRGHVVKLARRVQLDQTAVKVVFGSVHFHAVAFVFVDVVLVVVVTRFQHFVRVAIRFQILSSISKQLLEQEVSTEREKNKTLIIKLCSIIIF